MVGLDTPLRTVVGKLAPTLERTRGLRTVGDLLEWLPRGYVDPARPQAFASLTRGEHVVVPGTVVRAVARPMRQRKGRMLVATVRDAAGDELDLTFFRAYGHEARLVPGRAIICSGTVDRFHGRLQLTHPDYQVLEAGQGEDPALGVGARARLGEGPIPVYTVTKGLSAMQVSQAVGLALHAVGELPDPIPARVRLAHGLPALAEAYRMVHEPRDDAEQRRGRWRLKFQEAFVVQAVLAQRRHASDAVRAVPRAPVPGGLVEQFRAQLPFRLTPGQEQVLGEVLTDLRRPTPMHRLLQGEVGSGKTVVALLAMLAVVDSGGQAALLAPTEVLALQHHRSITRMLGPLAEGGLLGGAEDGTRVALLTGGQPAAERRAALLQAASGEAGIVVGTHALIQEHVQLADLGLVVVDEQHRFGVEQRDALRAKAAEAPHVLTMTATPIPRTVAMTVYGDMETSVLRELPVGRQPITTHVVAGDRTGWVARTWERVAEEVGRGGQVYVVCPRIGTAEDPDLPEGTTVGPGGPLPPAGSARAAGGAEDDGTDLVEVDGADDGGAARPSLHGVLQVERALRALPATAGLRIAALHGRMSPEDKDAVMSAFAAGEVDVLVATTVIEVGVDVPDATQMVIVDADRFGVSQLHQLRGRVGRGGQPGLCLLLTQHAEGPGLGRLEAVASRTDGFELARLDLEQRREGDVLGASQSGGRTGLRFLRLTRDEDLIVSAHEAAWDAVRRDPDLLSTPALREELERIDPDRAAFLERG